MFFKRPKQEADILPPPPPFPKLEEPILEKPVKEGIKKIKPKKEVKKKEKAKIGEDLEKLEKEILTIKPAEEKKLKIKGKKILRKKLPKIKKPLKIKTKQKIFGKRIKEEIPKLEEPLPELEPIEIEKPSEMFHAENEISKAIEDLKKPKKSSFRLFKPKEKPSHEIKLPEMPRELPEELPPPEIEEPKDEVTAIKHKIHDARNALMDFDLAKAKLIYTKLMRMYNSLSPEKQAIVYEDIRDLYDDRKNAESLNIKA